ncbi:hypothetical protein ES703_85877 [subsurface metagenome]
MKGLKLTKGSHNIFQINFMIFILFDLRFRAFGESWFCATIRLDAGELCRIALLLLGGHAGHHPRRKVNVFILAAGPPQRIQTGQQ